MASSSANAVPLAARSGNGRNRPESRSPRHPDLRFCSKRVLQTGQTRSVETCAKFADLGICNFAQPPSDGSKFEAAYKRVAGYIYNTIGMEEQQRSVLEIAEDTEESPVLVDALVDLWATRGLVKTTAVRPQFRNVVWEASPLLEEESS